MNNILNFVGRKNELFSDDIKKNNKKLKKEVSISKFLVIGGGPCWLRSNYPCNVNAVLY
jgi:hypothetical protein